jgi:hypothetical protein
MDSAAPNLIVGTEADVPAIAALMNLAFRGGGPDAGWNSEADHFQGDRTNADAAMLVRRSPEVCCSPAHSRSDGCSPPPNSEPASGVPVIEPIQ